jgi:hypothetical protein
MTSQSPRIYIYKITFEEVPYYYYGVHKEKRYNGYYMGSPVTNKWYWELYTPKKQILQFFDFTDEGYIEAQEVERRLIKPFYNTDKWCLNENVGGIISLKVLRETGKKTYELGLGVHGLTPEQRRENSRKGARKGSIKGGKKIKELGIGIHGRTKEQIKKDSIKGGKISGKNHKENKTGIFGLTPEQTSENARKAGKLGSKITNSQKWMCLETGFITNPGNLTKYQNAREIDTSKRIRIS